MKPKPCDYEAAAKLENYVRKRYRNQLSNGALSFYLCAMPYLERQGLGLCAPITATYHDLATAGFRSPSRIRDVLDAISGVLCEVIPGNPIKNGRLATQIRRYSLQELMQGEPKTKLVDYAPPDARTLADVLQGRSFVYGDDAACRPHWNIKTNQAEGLSHVR